MTQDQIIRRYPRIIAHIIAHSLGYATPRTAAVILADARAGRENWCEWVGHCYAGSAVECVRAAIRHRHTHKGYMASYQAARLVVAEATKGSHPLGMSWP